MVYSFTFPQEIIDSIQERIEVLERCLNDANPQDEAMAEIIELANSREISLSQLKEECEHFIYKLNRFTKLRFSLNEKIVKGELSILMCVKCNFAFKEIVDLYFYLLLENDKIEILRELTSDFVGVFNQIKIGQYNEVYIIVESLKHLLQSLIKVSLQVNAFTEQEINAFNLGDITPQESEAMLISLASTKEWNQTYKNLANNQRENTVESLLNFLQTSPGWVGDDFEECLEYVNEVRRQ